MRIVQTLYAELRILNAPKNLVRQKISKHLIELDKRNFTKQHTSVSFNLHVYMNQLTNNTNSDLTTEKDRPMTLDDAKSFYFEDNPRTNSYKMSFKIM